MRETITALLLGWSRAFPATPENARQARQFLATILDGRPVAADAIGCLSELVTNATLHSDSRHPGGRFTVYAQLQGDRLRVSVTDEGGPWEQVTHSGDDEEHGRGLLIVARLTDNWGRTGDSEAGWTVWFEMAAVRDADPCTPRPSGSGLSETSAFPSGQRKNLTRKICDPNRDCSAPLINNRYESSPQPYIKHGCLV